MKKLLLPLLIASMFANAEEYLEIKALKNLIKQENTITTAVGEYKFGPDTSESDACTIAESIAKENAILKVTGESLSTFTIESCKEAKCDIQKDVISDSSGYIKSIIEKDIQTNKALGYNKCTVVIRADVGTIENPIKFKLDSTEFYFNGGDEVVISGSSNKQGFVVAFLFTDGIYHLIDGSIIATSPGNFMLPSSKDNRLIAYLPQNKLQSKELLTVLFIENDDRPYNIKQKYNKVEMENLLNTVPVQKRKVINNHVYIMKRGNTI